MYYHVEHVTVLPGPSNVALRGMRRLYDATGASGHVQRLAGELTEGVKP
jgi:hypothetical protein